jgi:hypothetical protein
MTRPQDLNLLTAGHYSSDSLYYSLDSYSVRILDLFDRDPSEILDPGRSLARHLPPLPLF